MKQKIYMQCLLHVILASMIILIFSSNVAFDQKNEQPRDVISDSTYTYIGWAGNPESITVYIDETFSVAKKDSIRVAIQRWNNAGCVPALTEVTTGPANVTFTEGDPGVDPETGEPNAGVYNWEMGANDKVVRGTIIIRDDPNPGLVETATHELGHALGLDDTDPNDNPGDVMKGSGPSNGTNGELSPHDLSQLQAAAAVANTPVGAPPVEKVYCIEPMHAITPGGYYILSFELPFDYPPDAEYVITPIANDLLFIEFVEIFDNNLNIGVLTEPDHWSGQIYFDINIFMYDGEMHHYNGVHYVSNNPVPPVEFDCPFNVFIDGNQVLVQWNGLHTYPFPDRPLRSTLSVNGNQFYKVNPSADAPPDYFGDYTITLPPGLHELTLVVNDYQVNRASFTMDVVIEEMPPQVITDLYLRPGEKTNPETWYAWIGDPSGQTQVKLFANDPDKQIQTVEFFYKTDQTTEEWMLFDTDHDGFSYKAPGPNTGYQGEADGWSGYLPHYMIDQDELLTLEFMAHIITLNDEIITINSETSLTYDPTPPSSFYLTVEDGFITDQDFLTIQLIPEMANLDYVVFNVSDKPDEFQKNIPHTYQGDENSCGPHSLAACLKYFANEGYEGIDGGLDIGELAEALKTYVDNDDDEGAFDDDMAKGADDWIKEKGGGFTVTGPIAYEEFNTTRMRQEFEGSALFNGVAQNIIPLFLWVKFNEQTEKNDTLGHFMTLSSIHNVLEDGKRKLDFMDPANPGTNYIYGYVDEETGVVSGFGNQIPDGGWIHSVIMICPDEPSPNPGGHGTTAEGPEPEPVELPMPTEGGVVIRTRAVDQDGHKAERDITGTRVRPAEYPPGDIIVGLGEPPIILEGGIPAGGTYSGPHIINGVFHPVEIGVFLVTYTVVYPSGFLTDCDFTITVIGYDFGDAPDDPYPTLLASDGARHVVGQALYLGQLIDPEPDGQPCPFALGDDQDGTDDEDGVRFLNSFVPGEAVAIEVTVHGTGYLNAWFDWDADGSWGGPFEHVIVNEQVNTGIHIFTINVPANASPGFTFARFRLTSQSGLSYKGPAPDGEVEDYRIRINEPLEHKMHYPQYPDPSGWDVKIHHPYSLFQIGDDWQCTETGFVENIQFWVSWKNDLESLAGVIYNVKIYSDLPAHLSPFGYSMPNSLLWERDFAPGMYNYQLDFIHPQGWFQPLPAQHNTWDHQNCYRIDIDNFSDPFLQEAGEVYWLVISAEIPPFKAGDEEVIILSLQNIDPQTQPYDVWHEQGFALSIQHHPFAPDLGFSLPPDGGVGLSPALLSGYVDVNYTNADFITLIEVDIIEFDEAGSTVAEFYVDDVLVDWSESTQMGEQTLVLENIMFDKNKQPAPVTVSVLVSGYNVLIAQVRIFVIPGFLNYQTGWKTSLDHFNGVAVLKNPYVLPAHGWQLLLDPITQHPLSLAFVINGNPAEEPEMPDFLTVDDIIVPAELDTCFNAEKTIFVHNLQVLSGGRADLIAGESIIFYPGTKVHHGGEMWARITKDGSFCGYFDRHFLATEPVSDNRPSTSESELLITDEVREQPEAFFKLFPNPTRDRFTVELLNYEPGKPVTIEVYSMLGECILHEILPADQQHMFSIETQHPGLYLVRVLQGDRTGVERLILR